MTTESRDPEITLWRDSDERFCTAMRTAINAGLEHPPAVYIRTDETPPPPGLRFHPHVPPAYSQTGSPSAECAED